MQRKQLMRQTTHTHTYTLTHTYVARNPLDGVYMLTNWNSLWLTTVTTATKSKAESNRNKNKKQFSSNYAWWQQPVTSNEPEDYERLAAILADWLRLKDVHNPVAKSVASACVSVWQCWLVYLYMFSSFLVLVESKRGHATACEYVCMFECVSNLRSAEIANNEFIKACRARTL